MSDSNELLQGAVAECFRAARLVRPEFGAWYLAVKQDPRGFVTTETAIIGRAGVRDNAWLDRAEAYHPVLDMVRAQRRAMEESGQPAWRVLLLGGDDTGGFQVVPVYDDDPAVAEWDFEPTAHVNIVAKAMPVLDVWPPAVSVREHVSSIVVPAGQQAPRAGGGQAYGVLFGVVDLSDPDAPVVRSQIRRPDGGVVSDWMDEDLTAIVVHNAARYRRWFAENGYQDWTVAGFGRSDQGRIAFKTLSEPVDLTVEDPTAAIDAARAVLKM